MTIELKPCPFCGSQANLRVTTSGVHVRCRKCSIGTLFRVDRDGEPDALRKVVEDWNRRDPVEVVKCKDCKHWTSENGLLCEMWNRYVSDEEFFCGFGERRESNE